MSAITTHYRRVHGVDSASLGDLTWLTSASLSVRSASPTTQPVVGGKAHPDARGAAKKPMASTSMRRLVDNMRSVLLSAAAHINGDPGIPQDEKTALLAACRARDVLLHRRPIRALQRLLAVSWPVFGNLCCQLEHLLLPLYQSV